VTSLLLPSNEKKESFLYRKEPSLKCTVHADRGKGGSPLTFFAAAGGRKMLSSHFFPLSRSKIKEHLTRGDRGIQPLSRRARDRERRCRASNPFVLTLGMGGKRIRKEGRGKANSTLRRILQISDTDGLAHRKRRPAAELAGNNVSWNFLSKRNTAEEEKGGGGRIYRSAVRPGCLPVLLKKGEKRIVVMLRDVRDDAL